MKQTPHHDGGTQQSQVILTVVMKTGKVLNYAAHHDEATIISDINV